MNLKVSIVPHTHWDREWYLPFQRFRLKLVDTIDSLLEIMESDQRYSHFLLDGQIAMIDDYLEVRPENTERIKSLAKKGRLDIGPWYVLVDEFLISGETLIRNLQMGMEAASRYSQPMRVGYLPDMFGHVAQMPQILSLAGIRQAVVWRGVPSAIDRTQFIWSALDGSTVLTEYLVDGYSNGVTLPEDPHILLGRLREIATRFLPFIGDTGKLLIMNGSDHQPPQAYLGETISKVPPLLKEQDEKARWKAIGIDEVTLEISGLPEAIGIIDTIDKISSEGQRLPQWNGELRSGARANLLMGVTSNRIDVKIAADKTFFEIEKRAEPYCTLLLPKDKWPAKLLEVAWHQIVRNAAHDSICACSVDEVVDEVIGRFAQARQIAEGLSAACLDTFTQSFEEPGIYIFNPSPNQRSGVVEATLGAQEPVGETYQMLYESSSGPGMLSFNPEAIKGFLPALNSPKIDDNSFVQNVTVGISSGSSRSSDPSQSSGSSQSSESSGSSGSSEPSQSSGSSESSESSESDIPSMVPTGNTDHTDNTASKNHAGSIEVQIELDSTEKIGLQIDAFKQDLLALIERYPHYMVNVHLNRRPIKKILAKVNDIPGYGWKRFQPDHVDNPVRAGLSNAAIDNPDIYMNNGIVDILVDHLTGTYSFNGIEGMGQLIDLGDAGDSYNYSPPPIDKIIDTPQSVTLKLEEGGPLRARIQIQTQYDLPDSLDSNSSKRIGSSQMHIDTLLELRADEPYLRVSTTFTNHSRDHRLRVRLPLPVPADHSTAGCAFGQVERALGAEGRPEEFGLPTFPSRGFVTAGGLTAVHQGLCEYELVEHNGKGGMADAMEITLIRSTAMLSRLGMKYRPFPAGPLTEVEGLQLLGKRITANYALMIDCNDPYEFMDNVFLPFEVIDAKGGGYRTEYGQLLKLHLGTAKVSALKRSGESIELRLFNPTSNSTHISIDGYTGEIVDLTGKVLDSFSGSVDLRPFGIITIMLKKA